MNKAEIDSFLKKYSDSIQELDNLGIPKEKIEEILNEGKGLELFNKVDLSKSFIKIILDNVSDFKQLVSAQDVTLEKLYKSHVRDYGYVFKYLLCNASSFKQVMSVKGVTLEKLHDSYGQNFLEKSDCFLKLSKKFPSLLKIALSDDDKDCRFFDYILRNTTNFYKLLKGGFDVEKLHNLFKEHQHEDLFSEIIMGRINVTYEQISKVMKNHPDLLRTVYDNWSFVGGNYDVKKLIRSFTTTEFMSINAFFDLYAKHWKDFTESHPKMNELLCKIDKEQEEKMKRYRCGYFKQASNDIIEKLTNDKLLEIFEENKNDPVFKGYIGGPFDTMSDPIQESGIKEHLIFCRENLRSENYSIVNNLMMKEMKEIEKSYAEAAAAGAAAAVFSYPEDPAKEEGVKGRKPLPSELALKIIGYLKKDDEAIKSLPKVSKRANTFAKEEVKRKFNSPGHNQSGLSK